MKKAASRIYLSPLEDDPDWGPKMEFRLTYDGPLKPSQRDPTEGESGDLDNRVKTLIDGLRPPRNSTELGNAVSPAAGETPFFCLLEDDDLVTKLSVNTDTLLTPPSGNAEEDHRYVKIVISVELKPYNANMFNLSFA
jgi:hypothetical protein